MGILEMCYIIIKTIDGKKKHLQQFDSAIFPLNDPEKENLCKRE